MYKQVIYIYMQPEAAYSIICGRVPNNIYNKVLRYAEANHITRFGYTHIGSKENPVKANLSAALSVILEQFFQEHPV